ncbi:hypothetical protein OA58_23965 [Microcystis aeruginosa NIES-88]|nr:hypothetical protein OA58_23965 [Microcystis aeruginosa NIES-88]
MSDDFYWLNEPTHYRLGNGLEISTDEKTDFWQNTHYGFQRDDGHCLLMRQVGDFSLMTQVEFGSSLLGMVRSGGRNRLNPYLARDLID